MLIASDEERKERCMEAYREEKKNVKRCIIQSKNKVNEQFGRCEWKKEIVLAGGK